MEFDLTFKFLKDLSKNNDRDWFEKNKPRYQAVKLNFQNFVSALLEEIIQFDTGLAGLDPKKLAFRIYRDVRFSKDKRPYKTTMGAGFSPNGKMVQEPGYYVHLEPGNKSMVAGGFYLPDSVNLSKIRQEIDYNAEILTKILNTKKFQTVFGGFSEADKLKIVPKGYSKEHPNLEWIKLKSFIVIHHFSDREVLDKKFLKNVAKVCKTLKPLNDFLKNAVA